MDQLKRWIALFLSAALLLTAAACGARPDEQSGGGLAQAAADTGGEASDELSGEASDEPSGEASSFNRNELPAEVLEPVDGLPFYGWERFDGELLYGVIEQPDGNFDAAAAQAGYANVYEIAVRRVYGEADVPAELLLNDKRVARDIPFAVFRRTDDGTMAQILSSEDGVTGRTDGYIALPDTEVGGDTYFGVAWGRGAASAPASGEGYAEADAPVFTREADGVYTLENDGLTLRYELVDTPPEYEQTVAGLLRGLRTGEETPRGQLYRITCVEGDGLYEDESGAYLGLNRYQLLLPRPPMLKDNYLRGAYQLTGDTVTEWMCYRHSRDVLEIGMADMEQYRFYVDTEASESSVYTLVVWDYSQTDEGVFEQSEGVYLQKFQDAYLRYELVDTPGSFLDAAGEEAAALGADRYQFIRVTYTGEDDASMYTDSRMDALELVWDALFPWFGALDGADDIWLRRARGGRLSETEQMTVYRGEGLAAKVKDFVFDNRDGSIDEKYFVVFWTENP